MPQSKEHPSGMTTRSVSITLPTFLWKVFDDAVEGTNLNEMEEWFSSTIMRRVLETMKKFSDANTA